jgi:hypothetical protein
VFTIRGAGVGMRLEDTLGVEPGMRCRESGGLLRVECHPALCGGSELVQRMLPWSAGRRFFDHSAAKGISMFVLFTRNPVDGHLVERLTNGPNSISIRKKTWFSDSPQAIDLIYDELRI